MGSGKGKKYPVPLFQSFGLSEYELALGLGKMNALACSIYGSLYLLQSTQRSLGHLCATG